MEILISGVESHTSLNVDGVNSGRKDSIHTKNWHAVLPTTVEASAITPSTEI